MSEAKRMTDAELKSRTWPLPQPVLDHIAALEAEIALYKPAYILQQVRRMPPIGMGSMSTCGCSSWTNGLGESGEYKCPAHSEPGSQS